MSASNISTSTTALTATGTTANVPFSSGRRAKSLKIVVAAIGTSVTVRNEYLNTLISSTVTGQSPDYVLSANGTYYIPLYDADNFVRGNLTTITTGTPTVTFSVVEWAS